MQNIQALPLAAGRPHSPAATRRAAARQLCGGDTVSTHPLRTPTTPIPVSTPTAPIRVIPLVFRGAIDLSRPVYGWLRGDLCWAPCYEGITPGVTTVQEALSLLQQNPRATDVRAAMISRRTWG